MSSIIYLVAAYAVVGLGLGLYLLMLRRQRAGLAEELAALPASRSDPAEPETPAGMATR
jgi:CcmD family protein